MPTLSLPDGSSVTWDAAPVEAPVAPQALTVAPEAAPPAEAAPEPSTTPTEADVQAALKEAPPRWVATAARFGKTFAASAAVTLAAYGGDLSKALHDPVGVVIALGTAVVMATEKFLRWKD